MLAALGEAFGIGTAAFGTIPADLKYAETMPQSSIDHLRHSTRRDLSGGTHWDHFFILARCAARDPPVERTATAQAQIQRRDDCDETDYLEWGFFMTIW